MKIRIGDKSSELAHQYQALLFTGQKLLGGKSTKNKGRSAAKDAVQIQSFAHLQQIMKQNA